MLKFLIDILNDILSDDLADVVLYLASFFHVMCKSDKLKEVETGGTSSKSAGEAPIERLDPEVLGIVFGPAFLRTREESASPKVASIAALLVKTLVECADEDDLWPSRHRSNAVEALYSDAEGAGATAGGGEDDEASDAQEAEKS